MSKSLGKSVKDAIHSRFFVGLAILCFIEALILMIFAITSLRTGLTVRTHCMSMSDKRDALQCDSTEAQWFYQLNFAALPMIVFVVNVAVAIKLLSVKGRQLALCWLWISLLAGLALTVLGITTIKSIL